jgi:FkbM family methyltransferase
MLQRLVRSAFHAVGLDVRRVTAAERSRLEHFFDVWRRIGPKPSAVLDVGANHGNWTRLALRYFPDARFVMVEPQERLRTHSADLLGRPNVTWITAGVSDEAGRLLLTLPEHDHSASFLPSAADARSAGFPQIEVPVVTLDEIARSEGVVPDIVKIDAEGFDLRVLRGGSALLGRSEVFLVECAICAHGLDNTLDVVVRFMGEHGYRAFDITDLNRAPRSGVLWLTEVVFVRRDSAVWSQLDSYA